MNSRWRSTITNSAARAIGAEPGELTALALSFAYFFCLLCGYYILRPLRDEMGIAGGVANLHWVFTATFLAMFAVVPLFGWITRRFSRSTFLPLVYLFFIVNLLLFYGIFQIDAARVWAARVFFVWLSVFNLFVISIFWSVMVDLYTNEQGRRLFGFIAAGGSIGAVFGPLITSTLAIPLGPVNLLLVSAGFLIAALLCVRTLLRIGESRRDDASYEEPLGGGVLDGVTVLARSRYLLGVALFIVGLTVVATFVYFEQAHIVARSFSDSASRTRFFARIDLAVNIVAVSMQIFGTGRVMRKIGVTAVLAVMPLIAAGGLALLAAAPLLSVLAAFQIVRRAGDYALTRPARELLFTVVTPIEKYRVKNVIDTLVYRAGDAIGAWAFATLSALGFGLSGAASIGVAVALLWLVLAVWLGRTEERRAVAEVNE